MPLLGAYIIRTLTSILLTLFFISAGSSAEGSITVNQIEPESHLFGILEKQIVHRDDDGALIKIENFLTESASIQNGMKKQIDYYENDIIYLFEIWFTDSEAENTNCLSKREYVDESDKIIGIDFLMNDGSFFQTRGDLVDVALKFTLKSFKSYSDYHKNNISDTTMSFEARLNSSMAYATFQNDIIPITKTDRDMIHYWTKSLSLNDFSTLYNKKILVKESGETFYILFQDSLFEHINAGDSALIYYYFIGGSQEGPVFLAIDYIEKKDS
ncbi:hypothetical protein [Spirochaeta isovalerica]|uniref:Uncharacterized protein n=1 Tax=Spirochaeta isovalerica TaxID=150 RepID=A0A841RF87_9SPIO|nr:hypothetical protein [Spirochaeta isovalerica]MBB6482266.1 hypothetical protein [Spirochaeta isovalerica]